jgi:hypothetical protein
VTEKQYGGEKQKKRIQDSRKLNNDQKDEVKRTNGDSWPTQRQHAIEKMEKPKCGRQVLMAASPNVTVVRG